MKMLGKSLGEFKLGRLAELLGLGLIGWHLLLIQWVTGNGDQLVLSLVFWGAIAYQVSHFPLPKRGDRGSRLLGGMLLGGLAIASLQFPISRAFVRLFPGWGAIAWVLLTVGWPTRQLMRLALLVIALMMPPRLLPTLLQPWMDGICTLTAQVAALGLHLIGFSVIQQGPFIQVPQGVVEVQEGCTGVALLGLLWQLVLAMVVVFPEQTAWRLLLGSGAIACGLSCLRVAVMAGVVGQPEVFAYWHGDPGNQIFTTLAFLLFGGVSLWRTED